MAAVYPIQMPKLMRQITLQVQVTGQRRAAVRVWFGTQLLKCAALVMGCGIEISSSKEDMADTRP